MYQTLQTDKPVRLLTDLEMLVFMRKMKKQQQRNTPTPLATVTYETLRYLEGSPCANHTPEQLMNAIDAYSKIPSNLSNSIIQQLVNYPPKSELDLRVIMGDLFYKIADTDILAILEISKQVFGT